MRHLETSALEPRCVVTRLQFDRSTHYYRALRRFKDLRRLAQEQTHPPVVVEILKSRRRKEVLFISIWPSEFELVSFTTLEEHVDASRWAFKANAKVWSGVFAFDGISSRSSRWIGPARHWHPRIEDWTPFTESLERKPD